MADLAISDVTWDGFTASWSPAGGDFDSFVIEVTNMENEAESQNLTLSGGALSLGISGLNPNTSYLVGLYGIHGDSVLEPLYIEATTGTCGRGGHWSLFLFYLLLLLLLLFLPAPSVELHLTCSVSPRACSKSAGARANFPAATSLPAAPGHGDAAPPRLYPPATVSVSAERGRGDDARIAEPKQTPPQTLSP